MTKKRALITGISGMMGSHLADYLLSLDYEVFGMERRSSNKNRINCKHLEGKITFLTGDLSDSTSIYNCLKEADPDEFYNCGAQSFVHESWNTALATGDITGLGVLRCLDAIRQYGKPIKFYQSSSSEQFGKTPPTATGCNEESPFYPRSPYGVAKLYGFWITKNYRESYNMFACSGILFNNESERRGLEFVTRKITNGVAKIHLGLANEISLGNLDAKRDWGYCPNYVEAIHAMLQQETPQDFVIATGESHSVREFLTEAFSVIGITDWEKYVTVNEKYKRPAEVDYLLGDASKAKKLLGWQPTTPFKELVKIMVENDIKLLSQQNHKPIGFHDVEEFYKD